MSGAGCRWLAAGAAGACPPRRVLLAARPVFQGGGSRRLWSPSRPATARRDSSPGHPHRRRGVL